MIPSIKEGALHINLTIRVHCFAWPQWVYGPFGLFYLVEVELMMLAYCTRVLYSSRCVQTVSEDMDCHWHQLTSWHGISEF